VSDAGGERARGSLIQHTMSSNDGNRKRQHQNPRLRRRHLAGGHSIHLPTNLTRAEVARELYVLINTVNSHSRTIYSKLGARDRSSAVRRTRELRLLSTVLLAARGGYADLYQRQLRDSPDGRSVA
jgi:hypothetical protein